MVKEKQRLFKLWKGPEKCENGSDVGQQDGESCASGNEGCSEDMEPRRQDYSQAKGHAKKPIFKAKNDERKKFCEDLERERG